MSDNITNDEYKKLEIKYNNLQNEYKENVLVQSMNSMKEEYNILKDKYNLLEQKNILNEMKYRDLQKYFDKTISIKEYDKVLEDMNNYNKLIITSHVILSDIIKSLGKLRNSSHFISSSLDTKLTLIELQIQQLLNIIE